MADRKTLQLCNQVFETLSMVLSGEFDDDILLNLEVTEVELMGSASQMLVSLRMLSPMPEVTLVEIMDKLQEVEPDLRMEIAAGINRKKTPKLFFRVLPCTDSVSD
ncbi:MAG: hypothetical protein ACKVH8_00440 [Pirellulales bacterium]